MAFVQDPGGAIVGLWQAEGTIGSERANEPGANCWNELSVSDVDKTAAFYQEVLGVQPNKQDMGEMGDYTTLDVDGRSVAGAMPLQPGLTPNWNLYINVEDTDGTVAKALELGGEVVAPAMDAPTIGRMAFLRDPQGALFNVIQNPAEEPPEQT
jgi:predicted enzyme related to lactoylglutathione lyase